jgi:6-hydroxytryprostatin B O-methyltransferase
MAMTNNLFYEPEPNHIAHTATSAMFVTNPLMHEWAVFMTERSALCASKMLEASIKWPQSLAKNHTGFNIAQDTELTFFEWLDQEPKESERFVQYMKMIRSSEGLGLEHLISGFDWASLGTGTVVDVRHVSSLYLSFTFKYHSFTDNCVICSRSAGLPGA